MHDKAKHSLEEAHALRGKDPIPLFLASEWFIDLQDIDRAHRYYARAVEVNRQTLIDHSAYIEGVGQRLEAGE